MLTKRLIEHYLVPGESLGLWPGVFHLTRVSNPGAAFGMLAGHHLVLAFLSLVVTATIIYWGPKFARDIVYAPWSLGLLVGGAAGNLVDRVVWGEVTDFFDFRIWPVFNIADCAIVVGAGLLLVSVIRYPPRD